MGKRVKLTYVDSDVLRAVWEGEDGISRHAMEILDDPNRTFASSLFLKLELVPKPRFNKRQDEIEFYQEFFDAVSVWAEIDENLVSAAIEEAGRIDLTPIDALHILSAAAVKADEFVTAEKKTKPFHRTRLVSVLSIRPAGDV